MVETGQQNFGRSSKKIIFPSFKAKYALLRIVMPYFNSRVCIVDLLSFLLFSATYYIENRLSR